MRGAPGPGERRGRATDNTKGRAEGAAGTSRAIPLSRQHGHKREHREFARKDSFSSSAAASLESGLDQAVLRCSHGLTHRFGPLGLQLRPVLCIYLSDLQDSVNANSKSSSTTSSTVTTIITYLLYISNELSTRLISQSSHQPEG